MSNVDEYYDIGVVQKGERFHGTIDGVIVTSSTCRNTSIAIAEASRRFKRGLVFSQVHTVVSYRVKVLFSPRKKQIIEDRLIELRPYYLLLKKMYNDKVTGLNVGDHYGVKHLLDICDFVYAFQQKNMKVRHFHKLEEVKVS